MESKETLCLGKMERIGTSDSKFSYLTSTGISINEHVGPINNHDEAFDYVRAMILSHSHGMIKSIEDIDAIGHRVVHGGDFFDKPVIITDEVIEKIEFLSDLAPLHNKANLFGIKACKKLFGNKVPQVAVFDTSYFHSLPPEAYMFAIPYEFYQKHHIRKYGFHGTSHEYVTKLGAKMLNKKLDELKIISCHLGNGSSITATKEGKAVDTSMGLTPLGGIMMGTRSGSLDPSVVLKMAQSESLSLEEVSEILHKNSGLKGVSGISNDDRDIISAENKGNSRASLAHKMMVHQIVQFIGAYTATLGGLDVLIFTGGIGENQWIHRQRICDKLSFMGLEIDKKLNQGTVMGESGIISKADSKIQVLVIPTNEELAIAKLTVELLKKLNGGYN